MEGVFKKVVWGIKGGGKMFDPTIYDNLKVVVEGTIYELDFSGKIKVTNRQDIVDLATMSRKFAMRFQAPGAAASYPAANIILQAAMDDLAAEMIAGEGKQAGCRLTVELFTKVTHPEKECAEMAKRLTALWNGRPLITQKISYVYGSNEPGVNRILLDFNRKINEDQLEDIPNLIDYSFQSLRILNELERSRSET